MTSSNAELCPCYTITSRFLDSTQKCSPNPFIMLRISLVDLAVIACSLSFARILFLDDGRCRPFRSSQL